MADEAWAFQYVELGADNERRMRSSWAIQPDRGVGSGAGSYRLRWPGHEFDVDESSVAAPHSELRSIRDRPIGAEIERSAPTYLIDRK